jgi:23S rRNA pseudouridine1911/1915/1917 synthase
MKLATVTLEVPAGEGGSRLDRFLTSHVAGASRSALRRLILDGRVSVDGRPAAKPGLSLDAGQRIEVELPEPPPSGPRAEPIPLVVVHEDEHLIVIDKPAGMVVHPGHGRRDGTLVAALLGRGTPLASTGAPDRPGIVHRLDEGTSGLIVVAKTDAAHRGLAAAFSRRDVEKVYLALVWGHPDPPAGVVERPIGRSRANRTKMSVTSPRGRPACTRYRVLERLEGSSLLEARPETGRTHQIRVHLLSIGHAIVGDERYGGRAWRGVSDPQRRLAIRSLRRLALHATRLAFDHPVSGARLVLEAPLPDDLLALRRALGGN